MVLGVLIVLAADRWSQEREESRSGAKYLDRIVEEIRGDSFLDAAVPVGLMDGDVTEAELAKFVALPSSTELLTGLGGHYFVTESRLLLLLSAASASLRVVDPS